MSFNSKTQILFFAASFLAASYGLGAVRVTSDAGSVLAEAAFAVGDVLPITLFAASDEAAGVFGLELDLAVATDDLVIRSVVFDPAFATVVGDLPEPVLPGTRFHAVRVQPVETTDSALGAGGVAVPFAVVGLEVKSERAFQSALVVRGRGTLVGEEAARTIVFDGAADFDDAGLDDAAGAGSGSSGASSEGSSGESSEGSSGSSSESSSESTVFSLPAGLAMPEMATAQKDGFGSGFIRIGTPVTAAAEPAWTRETADVVLQVHEPGGGPVSQIVVGRTYELHYQTTAGGVCGYAVHVVAPAVGYGFASASAPATGAWSHTMGMMAAVDEVDAAAMGLPAALPDGTAGGGAGGSGAAGGGGAVAVYPAGYQAIEMVSDHLFNGDWSAGPASGHLFDFVPEAAGDLNLKAELWWIDEANHRHVAMETRATFVVVEPVTP